MRISNIPYGGFVFCIITDASPCNSKYIISLNRSFRDYQERVESWRRQTIATFTPLFLSVKIVAGATAIEYARDGRRMILKRCRATISRVLLVHGPAVCRLTYDRQQLINAFMSIRLAVHHRFKPRPVQPNPPTSTRPTNQPPIQPPNEGDTLPTPPPPSSLSLSLSLFCTCICMSHALRAASRNLRYHHRDVSIR